MALFVWLVKLLYSILSKHFMKLNFTSFFPCIYVKKFGQLVEIRRAGMIVIQFHEKNVVVVL